MPAPMLCQTPRVIVLLSALLVSQLGCVPHCQHPKQLLWLLLLPLALLWQRQCDRQLWARKALLLQNSLRPNAPPAANQLRWLGMAGACMLIIALADPSWRWHIDTTQRSAGDLVLILDVSDSMLIQDVQEKSMRRLQQAKQKIVDLLDSLPHHRIGLIAMAGSSLALTPLTFDHQAVKQLLELIEPEQMPQKGTDFGAALRIAEQLLQAGVPDYRQILLLSDGEDHTDSWQDVSSRLNQQQIPIYTLAFGSERGDGLPSSATNPKRRYILSQRNDKHLCQLVQDQSSHCLLASPQATDIVQLLQLITKQATLQQGSAGQRRIWHPHYLWFALLAFGCLYSHWFLPKGWRWRQQGDLQASASIALLLVVCVGLLTAAAPAAEQVADNGASHEVLQLQLLHAAQRQAAYPYSLRNWFELGNLYYREQQFFAAEQVYTTALTYALEQQAGLLWYNLGHSLVRQGKWQAALQAYERAMHFPQFIDIIQPVVQQLEQRIGQTTSHGFLRDANAQENSLAQQDLLSDSQILEPSNNVPSGAERLPPNAAMIDKGDGPWDQQQAKHWLDNLRESPLRANPARNSAGSNSTYGSKDW